MVRGRILILVVTKAMIMLLVLRTSHELVELSMGPGRNAADGDGSLSAFGEHIPQNGVAGYQHQNEDTGEDNPLQSQEPWVQIGHPTAVQDSDLIKDKTIFFPHIQGFKSNQGSYIILIELI